MSCSNVIVISLEMLTLAALDEREATTERMLDVLAVFAVEHLEQTTALQVRTFAL